MEKYGGEDEKQEGVIIGKPVSSSRISISVYDDINFPYEQWCEFLFAGVGLCLTADHVMSSFLLQQVSFNSSFNFILFTLI